MTLATQAMEAFGISGQRWGKAQGGVHRAATLDRLAWRRISPWAKPLHGETSYHQGQNHAPPATQVRRNAHSAADQFHAAAVDGDVEDFELTVRLLAGPVVAVPAGSATITAPEERRQSRPTGRRYKPAGRWASEATEQQSQHAYR
jgi:hypothetical protein